jgi:hypothetical protein
MTLNIEKEIAAMRQMTVGELREKYAEVFGEATRSRHKDYLIKRIAWRMQANAEGGLSERARRRAAELANDADLRVTAPKILSLDQDATRRTVRARVPVSADGRLPLPGTVITRNYKGETLQVKVLSDGFEYKGERYGSLTAVAEVVTGKHWNGYHFFRLVRNGRAK